MTGSDTVTDTLRADILDGVFHPGDRLIELQLSDRYRCGRSAIRNALTTLTGEGLVQHETNRGATVRRISVEEAIEITEARAALEALIASKAAELATAEEQAELNAIITEMEAAVAAGESVHYSSLNRRFHGRLREIGRHPVASELVANLRNRSAHHQYRLALMPGRSATSLGEHGAIAKAVAAGDAERAAQAMRDHLQSVIDVLREWGDAPGA